MHAAASNFGNKFYRLFLSTCHEIRQSVNIEILDHKQIYNHFVHFKIQKFKEKIVLTVHVHYIIGLEKNSII